VRWFHTGGIYAALSETTPDVAREAIAAARRHGAVVSYDLNHLSVPRREKPPPSQEGADRGCAMTTP